MRITIVLSLLLFSLCISAQEENVQEESSANVFLNFNGSYTDGLMRQASIGLKLGAMPNENWVLGGTFEYNKIEYSGIKIWELKVGPMLRYYIILEHVRFFMGAHVSFSTFNTNIMNPVNMSGFRSIMNNDEFNTEILYYGPEAGISLPIIGEKVFVEFLVRHSWIAGPDRNSLNAVPDPGKFNYEIGFSILL